MLYDQTGNDPGAEVVSQNFETMFDTNDSVGTDDLTVPAGSWNLTEVDVTGHYFNGAGLARSESVAFYPNNDGRPGPAMARFPAVVGFDNGTGSFAIPLGANGITLPTGTYWVSVMANMTFALGGEWGWNTTSDQEGNVAKWRNRGDGFRTGCSVFMNLHRCWRGGFGHDFAFALQGTSTG